MSVSSPSRLNGQRERAETLLRTPSVGADCDSGYGAPGAGSLRLRSGLLSLAARCLGDLSAGHD
jgi:hypothetical protein